MQTSVYWPESTQMTFPGFNVRRPAMRFEPAELDPELEQAVYRNLALTILDRAILDARDPDPIMALDARVWLLYSAPVLLDWLCIDYCPKSWAAWVKSGCPKRNGRHPYRAENGGKKAIPAKADKQNSVQPILE